MHFYRELSEYCRRISYLLKLLVACYVTTLGNINRFQVINRKPSAGSRWKHKLRANQRTSTPKDISYFSLRNLCETDDQVIVHGDSRRTNENIDFLTEFEKGSSSRL